MRQPMGLYQVGDPQGKVNQLLGQASNSYGSMQKNESRTTVQEGPGKTGGGALMAGAGMGMAGAYAATSGWLGSTIAASSMAGPIGLGIGAAVGIGAYLLS